MTSLRTAVFLGAALALVGFGPARADIVIAVAGPMSGSDIVTGESVRWGAEMAVADLNANGGVLGQQVRLVVGDDACDGEQAVAVANKFVDEKVAFVAGHACSGSSIPASEIYEAAGIVMISPTSTNPKLTELGRKNVFRVCGRDDEQGSIAANYMADNWAGKTFAIIYDDSAYGQGLAEETKKQLNQRGITEVLYESYTAGHSDYSDLVSRLIDAKVDVVYIGGYTQEAALIIRQAADREFHFQSVSGDGTFADDFSNIAGEAANGALVTFFPDPRKRAEVEPLLERFRTKGYEPDGNTLYSYAAVQSWAQGVEQAKILEYGAVIDALKKNEFDTVLGRLRFNEKGDVNLPGFEWYVWKEGKAVPLE
jgi:branched-chain amino acid transport system substrate-binding protein